MMRYTFWVLVIRKFKRFQGKNYIFYTLFLIFFHCVKSVQIRSYFWSAFPVFGLYFVNLRIESEYRKIRTRNNFVFGHFSLSVYALNKTPFGETGFLSNRQFLLAGQASFFKIYFYIVMLLATKRYLLLGSIYLLGPFTQHYIIFPRVLKPLLNSFVCSQLLVIYTTPYILLIICAL